MRVLVIGDAHVPFTDWALHQAIARFAKSYRPDVIVQVGDFIDGHNWSRHLRYPDSPSAQQEWDAAEAGAKRFSEIYEGHRVVILEGNHDRRHLMRAAEVNIPSSLIRPLSEMFPYDNWLFWTEQRPYIVDGVAYIHGDEGPGNAYQKACKLGRSVVQGHLHADAGIKYQNMFDHQVFGLDVGCTMNAKTVANRYANQKLLRSWTGWATVTDGIPALYPFALMRKFQRTQRVLPMTISAPNNGDDDEDLAA